MANCANCGEPNSPECQNCTHCGKPVGGIRSAPPNSPTGGQTVFGTGSIGAKGKWFSGITLLGETAAREIAEQVCSIGPTDKNNKVRKPGTGTPKPIVYTIPQINIPVANTEEYEVSSNTELYLPAVGTEIGNGAVDYVKFAEKMQAQATELANNLQALKNQKGVSGGGAGGGVPDGPSCDQDVDYPANTFTIEVKSKFQVVPCEDPVPCEFTCSNFHVSGDGTGTIQIFTGGGGNFCSIDLDSSAQTVTLRNGTITFTIGAGGNMSVSGATNINFGSANITTTGTITSQGKVLHSHTHSAGTLTDSTGNTVTGSTGSPS